MALDERAAAYVPFGTFKNQLDRLKGAMPNQVDRSVFIGLAGGTQTQLVAALKFLNLIGEEDNVPSDALRELARADELARKPILKRILESAYADIIALDLKKATLDQVNETMEKSYGVTGSTRTKAVRFFMLAAEEAGIEMSPFLKKARASSSTNSTKRKPRKRRSSKKAADASTPASGGTSKTVDLESEGSLTLSADLDFFALSRGDRDFIFGLIAKMEEYEQAIQHEANGEEEEEEEARGPSIY